jgi:exodeoxyribonuclease V alpha subunit
MTNPADDNSAALAEGLGLQVEAWALRLGATDAAAQAAGHAARTLSLATSDGHVCLLLAELGGDAAAQRTLLFASNVVGTPKQPGAMPLILDDDHRLYLHRHFEQEQRLARRLLQAAQAEAGAWDAGTRDALDSLFGTTPGVDWQKAAAALALRRRLLVLSGGPGTGKTSTVVKLLAALLLRDPKLRIALCAPTGKAAARLSEAVRERAAALPEALRALLPQQASTVHRLLGARPGGFAHDAAHPLPLDLLVVDEASMLDLALATRLCDALPPQAGLILLGDKDQLAAVESGAVFAELSAERGPGPVMAAELGALLGVPAAGLQGGAAAGALRDNVLWFTRNYRFDDGSAIARCAAFIRDGDAESLLQLLRSGGDAALRWFDEASAAPGPATWLCLRDGYAPYLQALQHDLRDVATIHHAFERFRVLCAHREGARGVAGLNEALAQDLRSRLGGSADPRSPWFAGRPVMVLRNDPLLGLYNGDIGICLPGSDGELQVYFAEAGGGHRAVPPARLPAHETAFAMTVHKAQGSEFDSLLLLLPDRASRVLKRELLYTAVTRARARVQISGPAAVLGAGVSARTVRHSGLRARLREAAGSSPAVDLPT